MRDLTDNTVFESDFYRYMYEKKHIMLLYNDMMEYRYVASRFIADGLKSNDYCVMAVDEYAWKQIISDLDALGVNARKHLRNKRLVLIDVSKHYSENKEFDPDRTVKEWQDITDAAVARGFNHVRAVGEATFALGSRDCERKLIYYENIINRDLFPHYPFLSLCVYNKTRYAHEILKAAIQAHPMMVYGLKVFKNNIYYIPPEIFLQSKDKLPEIDLWISNVESSNQLVQEIVKNEEKMHTFFNKSNDAFYIHEIKGSRPGRILDANDIACNMLGYSREEILKLSVADIDDQSNAIQPPPVMELKKNKRTVFKTVHKTKDGRKIPVEVSASIFSMDGREVAFSAVRDISAEKAYQEGLIKAKEEAEQASLAKSMFLANMSHELRTPLNGIMGMHQLMQTTKLDQEQEEYVTMAIQSAKRLTNLLGDILDLAKIETGNMQVDSKPLSIGETFQVLKQLFNPACIQKGVTLTLNVDTSIPDNLEGDPGKLQQILNNLTGNAVKFTDKGAISCEASALPGNDPKMCRVLFSVRDTGIGIEESKLDYLFQAFTQADEGYRRSYQGAGLGLSIVHQLVTAMDGTLSVMSEPGVGTEFHVSLPFKVHTEKPEEPPSPSSHADVTSCSGCLLIVEDDRVNRMAIQSILEKSGYTTTVAENGADALRELAANHHDLVLMDVQMPVMDGVEATRAIRSGLAGARNVQIPIVALTAYAMSGDRNGFLKEGMDDYLSKPVDSRQILATVSRLLKQ